MKAIRLALIMSALAWLGSCTDTYVPKVEPSPASTITISAFSVHSSPIDGLIE